MKNQPAVSLYIVTYLNSEERCGVLKRTCEGALAQRYPDFEVVVGDNGGSIAAQEVLASIQDPRLRVCRNKQNVGFAGNINMCMEHCANDVIKPLCDDDLIHPDFLAQTVPFVDADTLVVADVEKYLIGEDPDSIFVPTGQEVEVEHRSEGYGKDLWSIPYIASSIPSATLFSRALFSRLGGYDGKTITSDYDFFIEACLHGKIAHVKRTLCYVGVWPGSLTEEMMAKPFFYPSELQYTKFRVLRCKGLSGGERAALALNLAKEFFWQSMRPLRHLGTKAYSAGYAEYARRFFRFLLSDGSAFSPRPSRLR